MNHEEYMKEALDEAFNGMRQNHGGPFGAVIVYENRIIGRGHNRVTSQNDPTAHAEILAIRDACKNQNTFDLAGAVLYTSCEPCPMCLAAVYWAKIEKVYYCLNSENARSIGFDDAMIAEEFLKKKDERLLKMRRVEMQGSDILFSEWNDKLDKVKY